MDKTNINQYVKTALNIVRSRVVVWTVTNDETRCQGFLEAVADYLSMEPIVWTCSEGLVDSSGNSVGNKAEGKLPNKAMEIASLFTKKAFFIFKDLRPWLDVPSNRRILRDLVNKVPNNPNIGIAVIDTDSPPASIPGLVNVDLPLPDRAEIKKILNDSLEAFPEGVGKDLKGNGKMDKAIDALLGLPAEQIAIALAQSVVECGVIDPIILLKSKKSIISSSNVLQWREPDSRGLDGIGGLGNLKAYAKRCATAYSSRARDFGRRMPRGILLSGLPGTGKSKAVDCLGQALQKPVINFSVGSLFSKYQGEAEANLRNARQIVESIAPCIVRLDEIEKAFTGTGGGDADGGVSSRLFGEFLTWLGEQDKGIFFAATSNDVTTLQEKNPEFFRAQRFDKIFWVEVPYYSERVDIMEVFKKKIPHTAGVDSYVIAGATEGYSGAEIEESLWEALDAAFEDGEREVTTEDVLTVLKTIQPISKAQPQQVKKLREWAKNSATIANTVEEETTKGKRVLL